MTAEKPRMTLRVYTVSRQGVVTRQGPETRIMPSDNLDPYALSSSYPPCSCPLCCDRADARR